MDSGSIPDGGTLRFLSSMDRTIPQQVRDGSRFDPGRGMLLHLWALSLVGRAPALHAGGQEFESPRVQVEKKEVICDELSWSSG